MNTVNLPEVIIVNGLGVILMVFLRLTRIENKEKRYIGDWLYDIMIWLTIFGCLAEVGSFLVDGRLFPGARILSYLLNSFCFIGTCSVGFLWCLYVELRIFNSIRRLRRRLPWLALPWVADVVMNLINFSGCGLIFTISEANVYQRGSLVLSVYVILFFYFIYSICLADGSGKKSLHIRFFPTWYFVGPCMLGTLIQGLCYGITIGWTAVALALLFVYIQLQSRNSFMDSLSGLYNRRYMDCILSQFKRNSRRSIFGIMIDVNGFKQINDAYGHSKGDSAIRSIGRILSESVPDSGIAIRYAGDEFILLLYTDEEELVKSTIRLINQNVESFNASEEEPYRLSLAMGYSRFDSLSGDTEKFLSDMDAQMYVSKQEHYQQTGMDRRRK